MASAVLESIGEIDTQMTRSSPSPSRELFNFLHPLGVLGEQIADGESFDQWVKKVSGTTKADLLAALCSKFSNPLLVLDYSAEDKWHLGLIPGEFKDLTDVDEGRWQVVEIVKDFIPGFMLPGPSQSQSSLMQNLDVSIHPQKLPKFVPKESDKGIHITVGMNDTYLEKEGKQPMNFDKLNFTPSVGKTYLTPTFARDSETSCFGKASCPRRKNRASEDPYPANTENAISRADFAAVFDFATIGFLNGNELTMDDCNGRTALIAILAERSKHLVTSFRKQFQITDSGRHPHMTLAYISYKESQSNLAMESNTGFTRAPQWAHEAWNATWCPRVARDDDGLVAFYDNPKFRTHELLPFLIPKIFERIEGEEQASSFKKIVKDFNNAGTDPWMAAEKAGEGEVFE